MDWIDSKNLPMLPDALLPVVIGHEKGKPISKDIKVISCSNQYWHSLSDDEQSKILELVEWTGESKEEYMRKMRAVLPKNPRGK